MPALEMAQDTGKLLAWLKHEGEAVTQGEPIMEIETDKVTVEIEAAASGTLAGVSAQPGDVIRVGATIAWIVAAGEAVPGQPATAPAQPAAAPGAANAPGPAAPGAGVMASPVARKIAAEHGLDLAAIKPNGGRVEKADVLAFLEQRQPEPPSAAALARLAPASPKARRLATEQGVDLARLPGSGPGGAVLVADVAAAAATARPPAAAAAPAPGPEPAAGEVEAVGTVWRVMAERMVESWTSVPHFYLTREVAASALAELRARITPAVEKRSGVRPTYTDLLVRLLAAALRDHPRVNASWQAGNIRINPEINIGLATATGEGLIVPVIHGADGLTVGEVAVRRSDLVARAASRKLRPADIAGGTFTLSNLGMYGVDAFSAIVNPPQAAILAVGRIADRVVAVNGQPAVRPMMIVTLSVDHRVVDGARAAKFLDDFVTLVEEPMGVLA